jgi:hypothetical protein
VALAAGTALLMLAFAGRYGYHRDELYFLAAGRHLAWGYPDQPPLVPLIARVMPDSLVLLRLPSTVAAALVVLLAGLIAEHLGARRSGQWVAVLSTALCGFVLGTGHLLSTSTFDVLGWVLVTWLALKERWLLAGLAGGLTFQANALVGFLLLALAACRPRSRGPLVAGAIALGIGLPYLVWQARHGWPQLDVARSIAEGGSGSSVSRPLLLPFLLLQTGPWLLPVWALGLRRLLRDPALQYLGGTFLVLAFVFLLTGGKPYYLAGLVPLLIAAGAQPLVDATPRWVPGALLVLSLPVLVFTLPLLPVSKASSVLAVNPDMGETIGWPSFSSQVMAALPPGAVVVTGNYGEAGALEHYTSARVYSGHNGYGLWGPPPGSTVALAVGVSEQLLGNSCSSMTQVGAIRSPHDLDNDENGTVLTVCVPRTPWAELWPSFVHVG